MSSEADSWSCKIEIRNESHPTETTSFTVIHDKSEMELAIRRAQAAVLSPHKDPTFFLDKSEIELKAFVAGDRRCLRFSKEVIQISVKDPDATDLSFVDLPGRLLSFALLANSDWHSGLIHNAGEDLITTVRQLVEHYIEGKKNTLVVIAMPMTGEL
jgi:hypothetical protein